MKFCSLNVWIFDIVNNAYNRTHSVHNLLIFILVLK